MVTDKLENKKSRQPEALLKWFCLAVIVFALGFSHLSHAEPPALVLVNSNPKSHNDFQAFLLVNDNFEPVVDFQIREFPTADKIKILTDLFAEAQLQFLQGHLDESMQKFTEVSRFAFLEDWKLPERKLIMTSLLRLAQLDQDRSSNWISLAAEFGSESTANKDLFPPPLIEKFQDVLKHKSFFSWVVDEKWNDFTQAHIDGEVIDLSFGTILRLPKKQMRITLYSNSFVRQTYSGLGKHLSRWSPQRRPSVRGSCLSMEVDPQLLSLTNKGLLRGYFDGNCIGKPQQKLGPIDTKISAKTIPIDALKKPTTTWYKNPWFWLGAGVTGALIVKNNLPQKVVEEAAPPTHKHGF